jgi:uncharacterized phage protein gp47/JayE
MSAVLTSTGLVIPSTKDILAKVVADQIANVDPALSQSPTEPLGQFNGIFAAELATAYEVLDTIYEGFDPDKSEGAQLSSNAALTGVVRRAATYSVVVVSLGLGASFSRAPGTMTASVAGQPGITFVNRDQVTSTTAGNVTATFRASVTGPVAANAGTLTVIAVPATGWTSITNALDAVPGTLVESDTALKIRRVQEFTRGGSAGLPAIRSALLDPTLVPGIISCTMLENVTKATDANGLPASSFCAVIWDGVIPAASNLSIAQAIWLNKPSGIQPFGSTLQTVIDSNGSPQVIGFSRAAQVPVYFAITVKTDPTAVPADGILEIKNAILALAPTGGKSVVALAIRAAALTVPGVLDVPSFALDITAVPVATANITITPFQIATFDSTRIAVTVT